MRASRIRHGVAVVAVLLVGRAGAQEAPPTEAPPTADELRQQLEAVEARLRELEALERARRLGEPDPLAPPPPAGETPLAPASAGVATVGSQGLVVELPMSMRLSVRGQLRVRGEARDPADYRQPGTFGRPGTDDRRDGEDFILQRTWIGLDFEAHEHLRAVVSIMDSRLWGDTPIGQDTAETYLREAFVEVRDLFDQPLDLKVGRGLLPNLGDQRLISSLDWANVPRLWDAVQLTYEPKGWVFTAFASNLREAHVQTPRGDENDDFWLTGVYASCRLIDKHELDGYFFWRDLSDDVFANQAASRTGDREDYTVGARVKGEVGPLGYSGEAVFQWGQQAGDRVQAFALAGKAWFTQPIGDGSKVRLGGEYAFASGDEDPTDGVNETFDPIFPFGHFFHGHMDQVLWRNLHAGSVQLAVFPAPWISLHSDGHVFWLDERKDAWYGVGKVQRRDASGRPGSHIGSELDLYVQVRLWENRVFVWTGYSHFWTGEYVRGTPGTSKDMDWAFAQVEFTF